MTFDHVLVGAAAEGLAKVRGGTRRFFRRPPKPMPGGCRREGDRRDADVMTAEREGTILMARSAR